MKNSKQSIQNLPLFEDVAEAKYQHGFKTKDDRKFDREQKLKRMGRGPLDRAPETGPACVRCQRWASPEEPGSFGECQHLVRIDAEVVWANVQAGTITDRETARKDWKVAYYPLRTGEAFRCSGFKSIDGGWYEPEVIVPEQPGTLVLRARERNAA